jgi:hypothetical protein
MNQVLAGVNASILQINASILRIDASILRIDASNLRMDASILQIQLQLMRALNKPVVRPDDELTPLAGVAVANFPATLRNLRALRNTHALAIIAAYAIGGVFNTVDERRAAIASYIGVTRYNTVVVAYT